MPKRTILIAEDEEKMRRIFEVNLSDRYQVITATNGEEAIRLLKETEVDLVLSDLRMPVKDGIQVLKEAKALNPNLPVILITAYGTVENAVQAMKEGAYDYLLKPVKIEEVELIIQRALSYADLMNENRYLRKELKAAYGIEGIISVNPKMREIMKLIGQVARSKATVLIQGESGTGKELVARAIHYRSDRADKPFIALNCAAIPKDLLESELFGHEKGAFTGAHKQTKGKFELADEGTLFLDEIGEMPLELQVKILRALEGYHFTRVGGVEPISVDIRVIAATNRDLKEEIRKGRFREELYYRLNVVNIKIPPLRERQEDIPVLVNHFLHKYRKEIGDKKLRMSPQALDVLNRYPWPGNVRELENAVLRAMVLAKGDTIHVEDLPEEIRDEEHQDIQIPRNKEELKRAKKIAREKAVRAVEERFIREALRRCNGNISRAAREHGMDRRQFQNLIKKHNILPQQYHAKKEG